MRTEQQQAARIRCLQKIDVVKLSIVFFFDIFGHKMEVHRMV
jgi:hypothetical protein